MSGLSEIFTPSFFMILAILFLLIALLVVYIENKWKEQNHKISSMLSLVSSLAEEINVLRFNFITYTNNQMGGVKLNNQATSQVINQEAPNSLIAVSDDEDEDDDEEEDDEEEDDEEEDDEDDDDDDDDDDKTTVLKLNISGDDEEDDEEQEVIEIGQSHDDIKILKVNMDSYENDDLEEDNDLEEFDAESISDLETLDSASEEKSTKSKKMDLKSISIAPLEETKLQESTIDYKKLPLPKLRSVVAEKKLAADPSKLKKQDLLKLLGVKTE
jgi:hypothetical protein